MYQIDVWICNFMVTYVWVSQPSHLPGMTEFHCFKCPHVSLPMCPHESLPLCQTKTCLGDPALHCHVFAFHDVPAESPPWHTMPYLMTTTTHRSLSTKGELVYNYSRHGPAFYCQKDSGRRHISNIDQRV